MLVLGVNKILKWGQIISGGRHYTCQTKEINGQLCYAFKKAQRPVAEYISDNAEELVQEGGKTFLDHLENKKGGQQK